MSLRAQDDEQLRARLVEMITASAAEAGVDPAETVDDFLRAVDDRTQEIGRQLVGELLAEILKVEPALDAHLTLDRSQVSALLTQRSDALAARRVTAVAVLDPPVLVAVARAA